MLVERGGAQFWKRVNSAKCGSNQSCSTPGWFGVYEVSQESLRKSVLERGRSYHQWNQNKTKQKNWPGKKEAISPQILSPETDTLSQIMR